MRALLDLLCGSRKATECVCEGGSVGPYELEEKIGEGGMGVVYKARRRNMTAAVKVPTETRPDRLRLFEREVLLTSRLVHPNTIAIYDHGSTRSGVPYYAMEWLDGVTLADLLARDGAQTEARVHGFLVQIARALDAVHREQGLVHRDIKPANLMLSKGERITLLDFGLATAVGEASSELVGTPLYMAPEAVNDPASADARTDIYALGAVAYELLAGVPVFDGATPLEICMRQVNRAPAPLSDYAPQISTGLEDLVMDCLAKDPGKRPPSAADVLVRLDKTHTARSPGRWRAVGAKLKLCA